MTTPLDTQRQKRAADRARAAEAAAEYHEREAAQERAKIATICATWQLDPVTFVPLQ